MSADLLHGDFGMSYRFVGTPVTDVIADGLRVSPILALAALAIAVPLGVAAGTFAALRRNTWQDSASILALLLGISIPNFAMATFLVYLLSVKLRVLPVAGWGTLPQAVLPVLILAICPAAYIARLARTYMLEVLQQDYIRTARAKGLPERRRHLPARPAQHPRPAAHHHRHHLRRRCSATPSSSRPSSTFPASAGWPIQSIFARDYPVRWRSCSCSPSSTA